MDSTIIFLFAAILIVAGAFLYLMMLRRDGRSKLDQAKFRSKWLSIENALHRDQELSYGMTIINADKLVDQALRETGAKGETMGERMKSSATVFSNRNAIWAAHKLRNQIAHEDDVKLTYDNARRALASFKQALKDLGAI